MTLPITLTEAAIQHLIHVIGEQKNREDGKKYHVRLGVKGSGCSGFAYRWDFGDTVREDDVVIPLDEDDDLVINNMDMEFLKGSTIDFVAVNFFTKEMRIINPNVKSSCGCGESFSV